MYTTPRDFLEFIRQFRLLVSGNVETVLEQQKRLNVGLAKLVETAETVANMQEELAKFMQDLAEKNEMADMKMKEMVVSQAEAEEKKESATKLSTVLEEQNKARTSMGPF